MEDPDSIFDDLEAMLQLPNNTVEANIQEEHQAIGDKSQNGISDSMGSNGIGGFYSYDDHTSQIFTDSYQSQDLSSTSQIAISNHESVYNNPVVSDNQLGSTQGNYGQTNDLFANQENFAPVDGHNQQQYHNDNMQNGVNFASDQHHCQNGQQLQQHQSQQQHQQQNHQQKLQQQQPPVRELPELDLMDITEFFSNLPATGHSNCNSNLDQPANNAGKNSNDQHLLNNDNVRIMPDGRQEILNLVGEDGQQLQQQHQHQQQHQQQNHHQQHQQPPVGELPRLDLSQDFDLMDITEFFPDFSATGHSNSNSNLVQPANNAGKNSNDQLLLSNDNVRIMPDGRQDILNLAGEDEECEMRTCPADCSKCQSKEATPKPIKIVQDTKQKSENVDQNVAENDVSPNVSVGNRPESMSIGDFEGADDASSASAAASSSSTPSPSAKLAGDQPEVEILDDAEIVILNDNDPDFTKKELRICSPLEIKRDTLDVEQQRLDYKKMMEDREKLHVNHRQKKEREEQEKLQQLEQLHQDEQHQNCPTEHHQQLLQDPEQHHQQQHDYPDQPHQLHQQHRQDEQQFHQHQEHQWQNDQLLHQEQQQLHHHQEQHHRPELQNRHQPGEDRQQMYQRQAGQEVRYQKQPHQFYQQHGQDQQQFHQHQEPQRHNNQLQHPDQQQLNHHQKQLHRPKLQNWHQPGEERQQLHQQRSGQQVRYQDQRHQPYQRFQQHGQQLHQYQAPQQQHQLPARQRLHQQTLSAPLSSLNLRNGQNQVDFKAMDAAQPRLPRFFILPARHPKPDNSVIFSKPVKAKKRTGLSVRVFESINSVLALGPLTPEEALDRSEDSDTDDFFEEYIEYWNRTTQDMIDNPCVPEITVDDVLEQPELEPALHGRLRKRLEAVRSGKTDVTKPVPRKKRFPNPMEQHNGPQSNVLKQSEFDDGRFRKRYEPFVAGKTDVATIPPKKKRFLKPIDDSLTNTVETLKDFILRQSTLPLPIPSTSIKPIASLNHLQDTSGPWASTEVFSQPLPVLTNDISNSMGSSSLLSGVQTPIEPNLNNHQLDYLQEDLSITFSSTPYSYSTRNNVSLSQGTHTYNRIAGPPMPDNILEDEDDVFLEEELKRQKEEDLRRQEEEDRRRQKAEELRRQEEESRMLLFPTHETAESLEPTIDSLLDEFLANSPRGALIDPNNDPFMGITHPDLADDDMFPSNNQREHGSIDFDDDFNIDDYVNKSENSGPSTSSAGIPEDTLFDLDFFN